MRKYAWAQTKDAMQSNICVLLQCDMQFVMQNLQLSDDIIRERMSYGLRRPVNQVQVALQHSSMRLI